MSADEEHAAMRDDLRVLDEEIQRLRSELQDMPEYLREPDESATAGRMVVEQLLLVETLETRRDELLRRVGQTTAAAPQNPAPRPSRQPQDSDAYADALRTSDEDPAVWPEEWVTRRGDQISSAADVDDPVEALEVAALWAGTEADSSGDATELADRAAPAPPEEAALTERIGVGSDVDELTIGLPPGVDLNRLEERSSEDLTEAALVAADEGDPETAAIILDEIQRRRRRVQREPPTR